MSARSEFEGKDLEEALERASSTLGIPEDDIHYEILEQGRRGVLGLGGKAVRIRAKPPLDSADRDSADFADASDIGDTASDARDTAPARTDARPADADGETADEAEVDEAGLAVQRTLQQMLDLMHLNVEANAKSRGGGVSLELSGKDRKILLARNGELLSALQFVLNRMSRRAWPGAGRIHVGCEGESGGHRRDEEIVQMAREVAQQVARTGRTNKLHPLNSYERRLVHLTIREFGSLTSSSEGDGSLKRVRVSKVQNTVR